MRSSVIAMLLLSIGWVASGQSQQMRIVVIEAQHGKPVSDECLNISFGSWHGTDILARTNEDGVVILSIEKDRVAAETVPGHPCNGFSSTKPLSDGQRPTTISVLPDYYVSCQYSKALVKDPAWLSESSSQRVPSFAVQDILTRGIVATNSCSKLNPTPKPGELVLVVRKRTFMEGMRS
jgi:hypothetical protein